MLTAHQAYLLGFTPQLLGVFFNGLAVLEGGRRGAEGPLAEKIDSLLSGWVEKRGPEVVKNVHLVEALLVGAGKTAAAPPQSVKEFYEWADRTRSEAYDAAKAAFDAEEDVVKKTERFKVRLAHDLGEQMGDIAHTFILSSLVALLLASGPEHAMLQSQATALARSQRSATERMKKVLSYTAGYDDIQAEVQRMVSILEAGPMPAPAGTPEEHAQQAVQLAAVVPSLDLNRVEKLFIVAPAEPPPPANT